MVSARLTLAAAAAAVAASCLALQVLLLNVAYLVEAIEGYGSQPESDTPLATQEAGPGSAEARRELTKDDWAPTHYKLYNSKAPYMAPEIAHELLLKLEQIYEPFDDAQTNGRKTRIFNLLQASRMKPQWCTRRDLSEFKALIRYNQPFRNTLQAYLDHAFAEYLTMCENHILHNLHSNIENMNAIHRHDMMSMAEFVAIERLDDSSEETLGHRNLNRIGRFPTQLISGLLNYLGTKSVDQLDPAVYVLKKNGKREFGKLYEEFVIETCRDWVTATETADTFANNDFELHKIMTEQDVLYIMYCHMCQYIYREKKSIEKSLYGQLERKSYKHRRLAKAMAKLSCFTG